MNYAAVRLVRFVCLGADSGFTAAPAAIRQMLQAVDAPERMLGVLAEYEGHLDKAAGHYRSAEVTTNDPIAVYMLGRTLLENGDRDGAVAAWLRLESNAVREMARRYGVHAERALGRGEWGTVIDLGTLALALDPQLSQTHFHVGIAHARRGSRDEAIDAYQRSLDTERNPETRSAILKALGDAYAALGEPDRALAAYRHALKESGNNIPAQAALADLYRRSGLFSEAYDAYEMILAIDDRYVPAYIGIGDTFRDQGAYRHAQAWYDDARQVDPDSGNPELALGRLALIEGKAEVAIHYLLEAESLLPSDHKTVLVDLARSYRAAGRWADSVSAYYRAIGRVGDDVSFVWVWVELGRTLTEQGDSQGAREVWKHVLSTDPDNEEAANALRQSP